MTLDAIINGATLSHRAGGTAANVAANLAFLGWTSNLVGRLGRDVAGRRVVHDIQKAGAESSLVEQDDTTQTPVVVHTVEPPRHTFLFTCPRCRRRLPKHRPISARHVEVVLDEVVRHRPDVFFFDRASEAALQLAAALRAAGSLVMFEPSTPGVPERTLRAAASADVIKCSSERLAFLHTNLLRPRAGQLQIVTEGDRGCRYRTNGGRWRTVRTKQVPVVDTAGAGDWLTAGLLNQLPRGGIGEAAPADVSAALDAGQRLAALSCQAIGARTLADLPRSEVLAAADRLANDEPAGLKILPDRARSAAARVCDICLGRE